MKGLDRASRKVLGALANAPVQGIAEIAEATHLAADVVSDRLDRLHREGVIRGVRLDLDMDRLGVPHECMVTGVPSDKTTREALDALCQAPGVTRAWTLAARRSVAFMVRLAGLSDVEATVARMAQEAGLTDVQVDLVVDTLFDAPVHAADQIFDSSRTQQHSA